MPFYTYLKTPLSNKHLQIILLFVCVLFTTTSWSKSHTETSLKTNAKKVLFVLSSDSHGYFMSEVIEPYQLLQDAGFVIDIASPKGGQGKRAGMRRLSNQQIQWLNQSTLRKQLKQSIPLSQIEPQEYAAIYYAGGSGPMFDLVDNARAQQITREIYENDGFVVADCHGPVALINVKLSNGQLLIAGKKVTGKANAEEGRWARSNYPFLLENKMTELGALYSSGPNNSPYVAIDGRLITAQNPASATLMTQRLIKQLKAD